jgi:hypothetical protein
VKERRKDIGREREGKSETERERVKEILTTYFSKKNDKLLIV